MELAPYFKQFYLRILLFDVCADFILVLLLYRTQIIQNGWGMNEEDLVGFNEQGSSWVFLHYMHESRLITYYSWNAGLTKVTKLEFRLLLQIKLSPITFLKGLQIYEGIIYRRYRNRCHFTVYCKNYMLEDVYAEGRFKISVRKLFNRNPDNGNICPDLLLYNLLISN